MIARIMRMVTLIAFFVGVVGSASAVEWRNLDASHRIGGRVTSERYLIGKVALIYSWSSENSDSVAGLGRMKDVWAAFKTKPFVLIGSHRGDGKVSDAVKSKVEKLKISFPVYESAECTAAVSENMRLPLYTVVNPLGNVIYNGFDDRRATEVAVIAMSEYDSPSSDVQWEQFFNYETRFLPGAACLRWQYAKKSNPKLAKKHEELYKKVYAETDVKKLVELVGISRKYKDYAPKNSMDRKRLPGRIEEALRKYDSLKNSEHPLVAREAKNSLADLKWALAGAKR